MEEDDLQLLVGGPVEAHPGSRPAPCHFCNSTVWFAPSGQKDLAAGAVPCCLPCLLKRIKPGDFVEISKEALQEFDLWRKRN